MHLASRSACLLILVAIAAPTAIADEAAVRQFMASYAEAFNRHDAAAVAAYWAADGEHLDRETGERTVGRDQIQSDLTEYFQNNPEVRLFGRVEQVRLITPQVAKFEGLTTIANVDEDPTEALFYGILVQNEGKWLLASIEESPVPVPTTPYDALKELEWLIGRWVDQGDEARVDATVRWSPNQAFLVRSFALQTAEGVAQEGTEVIGWDPRAQQIRSWSFNSDGSFGNGTWSKNGEDWVIKSSQTLADGSAASGAYVVTPINGDTIAIRLIGHEIDGQPQPARPAVTVVRTPEATEATEATEAAEGEAAAEGSANTNEGGDQ